MCTQFIRDEEKSCITKLIHCYKQHRCLWDLNHEMYSHRDVRMESYRVLLDILKEIHPTATIDIVKRRIENLRSGYKRENNKVKKSLQPGKRLYVPKLWYYELLSFLEEKDIIKDVPMEDEENESMDMSESSATSAEPQSRPKTNTKSTKKGAESHPLSYTELQSIDFQLKQLNSEQRVIANKLIAHVIYYGKKNKLTESSSIKVDDPSENLQEQIDKSYLPLAGDTSNSYEIEKILLNDEEAIEHEQLSPQIKFENFDSDHQSEENFETYITGHEESVTENVTYNQPVICNQVNPLSSEIVSPKPDSSRNIREKFYVKRKVAEDFEINRKRSRGLDDCERCIKRLKQRGCEDCDKCIVKGTEWSEKDACELFLLSLVPKIKTMTELQQLSFQIGVMQLMQKIKYPDSD